MPKSQVFANDLMLAILQGTGIPNLLDNALKYRTPGRAPFIQICGEERGTKSVYRIEDNGVGIAPENHEKIWDIFHRLNPSGPVKGEGLGLAIVRRILDRHGGGAWVESKPGSGSCFYVELPGPEQDTFSNPPEPLNNQ